MSAEPVLRPHEPATFVERGVAVPFTTPMLSGGRVRAVKRSGLELMLPNPSGGRGIYVLPWDKIRAACRPTVHDVKLMERVAELPRLSPASMWGAAKRVAAEGYAGRPAARAAEAALTGEQRAGMVTNYNLLLRLIQQDEPGVRLPLDLSDPVDVERRAKRTIASLAPRLGRSADAITTDLEALAKLYGPIGLNEQAGPSRLMRAIEQLRGLVAALRAAPPTEDVAGAALANILSVTANATLAGAEQTLAEARANAAHASGLLAAWQADSTTIGEELARPDWLMDGWERVCGFCRTVPDWALSSGSVREVAALLPMLPRQALTWPGIAELAQWITHARPSVSAQADVQLAPCLQAVIARNEGLLAA